MKTPRDDVDDGEETDNAYSRAFSKIIKSSYSESPGSAKGPVLAARRHLVEKKLAAHEEDGKKKATKKPVKQEQERHLLPETFVSAKEMALMKLATKGVVTLFNAVAKAQKLQADTEYLKDRDKQKVIKKSKTAFLSEINNAKEQDLEEPKSRWSVLQDDFVLGKSKLKNWDKDMSGSSEDDTGSSSSEEDHE